MKLFKSLLVLVIIFFTNSLVFANESSNMAPDEAMQKLIEGNNRFVNLRLIHPGQDASKRLEIVKGQHPFVVILSCSDSRVPPEIVFDQGLGDIFEVRVAGNIIDDHVIGSIEYAVEHLGTPLVVVMGHQNCGAVTAAVKNGKDTIHIYSIVKEIIPAIEQAKKQSGDLIDNSVRTNVKLVVDQLKSSEPILCEYLKEGKIKIVGAYYYLDSGKVKIINP